MAGKVVVSTLNNDTGVLATQNGMTGIAKAWVNFDGTGTPAIRGSFNVSSITDNGTGDFTVNFTTALPNANYSANANCGNGAGAGSAATTTAPYNANPTTSAFRFSTFNYLFNATDFTYNSVAVFSS